MSFELKTLSVRQLEQIARERMDVLVRAVDDTPQQIAFRQGYIAATVDAITLVTQTHRELTGNSDE
jgi:hypothetical protein